MYLYRQQHNHSYTMLQQTDKKHATKRKGGARLSVQAIHHAILVGPKVKLLRWSMYIRNVQNVLNEGWTLWAQPVCIQRREHLRIASIVTLMPEAKFASVALFPTVKPEIKHGTILSATHTKRRGLSSDRIVAALWARRARLLLSGMLRSCLTACIFIPHLDKPWTVASRP